MEDKNEIFQIQISDDSKIRNTIINIGRNLDKDKKELQDIKYEEEDLYYYFFARDIYNKKCTKINNKEKFIKFINIINIYIKDKNDLIFLYFNKTKINLIKVLLNGYITTDIKEPEQKKLLLETIKAIFDLFFSKNLFYLVYNKLSKIFRQFNHIENKEILLDKFIKLFDIWNLLFDINLKPKIERNYFALIGNQVMTLMKNNRVDTIYIFIEFIEGIKYINNSEDISLLVVKFLDKEMLNIKFEDILNEQEKKNIKNILIKIDTKSVHYLNNIEGEFKESKTYGFKKIIDFNEEENLPVIEILKNYIGKIKKIQLLIKFKEENLNKKTFEIIPSANEHGYQIIPPLKENENEYFQIYIDNKKICSKIYTELLYDDLRYYGGMECFIPLLKIIKYFISFFEKSQDSINLLNNMIIIIIQNIIKFTLYSKINFENFKKILSSLIGALAEINHSYPNNLKDNLYSHPVFSLLYILIMISSIPLTLIMLIN